MATQPNAEADRNYEAFAVLLPGLLPDQRGRFALMHDAQIVGFYDSSLDATLEGLRKFGEGRYSVQEITDEPEHLGFYSYVGGAGPY